MEEDFGFPVVDMPTKAASSPAAAMEYLVGRLVEWGQIPLNDAPDITRQLLHRESLGSTAIGGAAAIPHIASDLVERFIGVIGRSESGFVWPGAADGESVRLVCVFVTSAANAEERMLALENLARRLRSLGNEP